jgi:glycosyltransferase involved in cell wall biosynthesis
MDTEKFKGADVVWAPYEPLIPVALWIREECKIPVLGHFEVIPPGRFSMEAIDKYWFYNEEMPDLESKTFNEYAKYRYLAIAFANCDIKTIIGLEQKYKIEKLLGCQLDGELFIKPYPLDEELLDKYKDPNIKEKRQILSILSLQPHKRTAHVIRALSLIKNPPELIIIGGCKKNKEGKKEEFDKLIELAKKYNVKVTFKDVVSDEEKCKLIQESMFTVHPWACLPVTEVAYFKKASICYDDPVLRDRLADLPFYVLDNNIVEMAQAIDYFDKNPEFRKKWGEKAYNDLISNKTHTHLLKEACKQVNETLILASKVKVK